MDRRGLTLTEVLVVMAILIVLTGLILPIVWAAKRSSSASSCVSNLHQLSLAAELYEQDSGGELPRQLYADLRPLFGYHLTPAMLRCQVDPFSNGANARAGAAAGFPISYYPLLTLEDRFMKELKSRDANYGVFSCLVHGTPIRKGAVPLDPLNGFEGLVLTARHDGSVQRKQVNHRCFRDDQGFGSEGRLWWDFFTDEPPPKEVVFDLTFAHIVPCSR